MRTNRRAVLFSAALFSAAVCVLGTGLSLPAAPPKDAAKSKNVPRKDAGTALSGVTTGFTAALPDPKRPGKLLYELRAASGNGGAVNGQITGTLNSVWARLYQNGVPAAVLTAPHAYGGDAAKTVTVTGTGGVAVKSLTEPGTTLNADTLVWYASQSKIVATGHVLYHNAKTGLRLTGPQMDADTRLKTISIPRSGHGTGTF